jgi:hypothetical protein
MPLLETEEMWAQTAIDEYKEDDDVNKKEKN